MTTSISAGMPVQPISAPAAGAQPDGLPIVAGGGSQVAGAVPTGASMAASAPAAATGFAAPASLVDAALAQVTGVTGGGGAYAPMSDPATGIPEFVQRYLPRESGTPMPPAVEGAWQQAPGTGPRQVEQGWAWMGCAPQAPQHPQYPPQYPVDQLPPPPYGQEPPTPPGPPPKGELPPPPGPPSKGELPPPPGPPSKGELPPPPGPPSKGELPPPPSDGPPSKGMPPSKGTPPSKGEPPSKGSPPSKVDGPERVGEVDGDRGIHVVGKGEYLSRIAPKYGITWQQLYWANKDQVDHPDLIHPGQKLRIPPSDFKVPDFAYTPMFTGAPKRATPSRNVPSQGTPPGKPGKPSKPSSPPPPVGKPGSPPPGKPATPPPPGKPDMPSPPTGKPDAPDPAKPTGPPSVAAGPRDAPPGTPKTDGSLPPAPPAPDRGDLPPELPG